MPPMLLPTITVDHQGTRLLHSSIELKLEVRVRSPSTEKKPPMAKKSPPMVKKSFPVMKKSPSAVFSWPLFVNDASSKDVMGQLRYAPTQARSGDTVRAVLWTLIKSKLQCLPVFHEGNRRYMGSIDMFDLLQYISHSAGRSIVRPDFFQIFKRMAYGDAPISSIIGGKEHSITVSDSSSLDTVFDVALSSNMLHIPVMNKQKMVGMVSQSKIVQYLANNTHNFSGLASKKLSDLNLSGADNLYTVEDKVPTIEAFSYMMEKGVRGVAVVNEAGQFVDAVNACDVKGLVFGDFFSDLRQPVLRYLSKARILLGRNLNPIFCTTEETLSDALKKMSQEKVSRIFIVDAERKPVMALSLRDILKVLHATPPAELNGTGNGSGAGGFQSAGGAQA